MAVQKLEFHSSAFWNVEWDDESLNLYVIFEGARGAPRYTYPGVGADLIEDWQAAKSKGSYFHQHIKPLSDSTISRVRGRLPRIGQIASVLGKF